jgi:cbb3-type cytochrome oxidase subunit 3
MRKNHTCFKDVSVRRLLSIGLMVFCLLFLTSLNYFLYPGGIDRAAVASASPTHENDDEGYPCSSSGPTEEKASSGFSILEEFLHENHLVIHFDSMNEIFQHKVAEAQKIEMVHTELITPPPKA